MNPSRTYIRRWIASLVICLLPLSIQAYQRSSEADFIYAKRLYEDGLYDLAAEALERYIESFPDSPDLIDAAVLIGESYYADGDYKKARNAFQRLAMDYPDDQRSMRALTRIADCYLALNDRERAAKSLMRVPVFFPSSALAPSALVRASKILVEDGKWVQAEVPLQQIFKQYSDSPFQLEAHLLWGQVRAGQGRLNDAIKEAENVVTGTRNDSLRVEGLRLLATWFAELRYEEASERYWRQILEEYPKSKHGTEALIEVGNRRMRIGDLEEANSLFERALENSASPEAVITARIGLGDVLFLKKKYTESIAQYQAIEKEDRPDLLFRLALAHEHEGNSDKAITIYERLVNAEVGPLATAAAWRAAKLQNEQQRYHESAKLYLRAESLESDSFRRGRSRYLAAKASLEVDPQGCSDLIKDFANRYPNSSEIDDVMLLSAEANIRLKHFPVAVESLRELSRRYPLSPHADESVRRANYIEINIIRGDDPSAQIAALLSEIAGGMDARKISFKLGEIYLEDYKDFQKAADQFRTAINNPEMSAEQVQEANILLAESIWRGHEKKRLGDSGLGIRQSPELARERAEAVRELTSLKGSIVDERARSDIDFRINLLSIESRTGDDKIRFARNAWLDFLADHPESLYAPDAHLRLSRAFTRHLPEDSVATQTDPAIWYLETLRNEFPESDLIPETLILLAERYETVGQQRNAVEIYRDAAKHLESSWCVVANQRLAENRSLSVKERMEAMNFVKQRAFYNPAKVELQTTSVELLLETGDFKGAEQEAKSIIAQSDPGDSGLAIGNAAANPWSFTLGKAYQGLGRNQQAIDEYLRYLAFYPEGQNALDCHLRLGELREEESDAEAAIRHYSWLIERSDENELVQAARRRASRLLLNMGRYAEARTAALEAAGNAANIDSALHYAQIATICLYRTGKLEEAREEARGLRNKYAGLKDVDNAAARFYLEKGRWLSKTKQYDRAGKAYRQVIKKYSLSPWTPEAKFELARDYMIRKMPEKGLEILTSLPVSYPDHPIIGHVFMTLGNYYVENENILDGVTYYERVIGDEKYRELWPFVYNNLILSYRSASFYAGALKAVHSYLEKFPDAPDAFDKRFQIGQLYIDLGQLDLAIKQFRELKPIADVETEAACQFYIGEAFERQSRFSEAIIEYKKVDYLGKQTKLEWAITAIYNAGRCFEKLGETVKAEEMYQEIVERVGLSSPFGRKAQEQIDRLHQAYPTGADG